jgi:hypothetical protein
MTEIDLKKLLPEDVYEVWNEPQLAVEEEMDEHEDNEPASNGSDGGVKILAADFAVDDDGNVASSSSE